ncbi:hypothetical protein [Acidisoma cladoniae]|jgi:hypothetical protein|uniref:hypothetical protein n=1 Tax=Acidisoma cladoniae TaxID=3040935 RepID=UPI00254ED03A|nr:hypothetical protein [Acidisoma sp. PAMC 29798]
MRKNLDKINGNVAQASRKPRVSRSAARAIAERVEDARSHVMLELGRICKHRNGYLTDVQVAAIAAVMSHVTAATNVPDELAGWLAVHGGNLKDSFAWAHSPIGVALIAAACTRPKDRRDLPAEALRRVMAINDEEAERLVLHQLAPKRVRDRNRRRAEGVMARKAGDRAEPWKERGVSKANYYRQIKREKAAALERETFRDPIAHARATARDDSFYLIGSPEVSPPSLPLTIAELPTSEGRRYAALALRLGAQWTTSRATAEPDTWFEADATQAAALEDALEAAISSQQRVANIAHARGQIHQGVDCQSCPPDFPAQLWAQVPVNLRLPACAHGGRLMFQGYPKVQALAIGVVAAERELTRFRAISAACPEAEPRDVQRLAAKFWELSVIDAVEVAADELAQRQAESVAHLDPAIVARAELMMMRLSDPPCPNTYRAYALEALQRMLIDSNRSRSSPLSLVSTATIAGYHRLLQELDNMVAKLTNRPKPDF